MGKIARLIYAASEHSADLLYGCGFAAPDPFIWFETATGERGIIVSALEYSRALTEVHDGVTVYRQDQFVETGHPDAEALILAMAKKNAIKRFVVPESFPLGVAEKLRHHRIKLAVIDGCFFPEREFKVDDEIAPIRDALRLTTLAMYRATAIIGEATVNADNELIWQGRALTSEIVRAEINIRLIKGGGFSDSTIVAGGSDGSQPHNRGAGQLFAGQPIVVDIFPRMADSGYWGDMTRTFVKGQAPDIVKRAFNAVREARDRAKELIKPGAIPAEIHQFALECLKNSGFATGKNEKGHYGFFHGLGHGLGLDIHEAPRLSAANRIPLRGGEVVTVEPGLYYPEWGGVRLEDVVVVTENGCECLTECDTELET
ncbi:MAG: Xaa-Pro peptidase family protein [Victivallaceae bacterium]|nr:Xaa-Pro peptidase family protein [Victivallaceae bacterium]